jgi:hypothetical protein
MKNKEYVMSVAMIETYALNNGALFSLLARQVVFENVGYGHGAVHIRRYIFKY